MRIKWSERSARRGWNVQYTCVGGSVREPLARALAPPAGPVARFSSQAFVAVPETRIEPSPDTAFWAAVCRKLFQRSTNPLLSPEAEHLLVQAAGDFDALAPAGPTDALAALCDDPEPWTLDAPIAL